MAVPEQEFIIDPFAEKGPQNMNDLINRHIAIRIGQLSAVGMVFRAANEAEVAAHATKSPEAHAQLREEVERNLAERASWGALPAGYEQLHLVEDTDAA